MTLFLTLLAAALTRFADPFVGTGAHGHTFPGAVAPFGMIQLSPDTRPLAGDWDGCSGYHYSDSTIYGFSHTHLSGTGCDDWCDVLVSPGASTFKHSREKAEPGFYSVRLDNGVRVRLAAGRRSAMHDYTFSNGPARLTVDLRHRDPLDDWEINYGTTWCSGKRVSSSWARGQQVYFYMEFSAPGSCELLDDGKAACFTFPGRKVSVRVGISSVSEQNAKKNLLSEYPQSLKQLKKATRMQWEAYLGKLECPYTDREHKRRFYTALYHTGIHPSLYSDANGEYRGMDGKVYKADGWERYTVFSLWDTFRGEHPLLFDIEPERSMDFIRSMISIFEQNGKLPVWELSGWETDCMIGYNSAPVIAEAVARGMLGGELLEKAYEALKASSLRPEYGLDSFRRNGLVLADDEHESVSKTLEYAYDDWCVAQVAKALGRQEDYESYMRSSQYWRNVLDPESGFMRARLGGRWFSPFDPREVNNNYTEANSWQYSFFVPHDVPGLMEALGGPEAFEHRIDSLFTAPEGTTGRDQADITGCIGQYAHGNEPSHHIPWLYAAIGKPEKAQAIVDKILETLYTSAPDGLCGNDDCGQMSAWYVLSSLGRYPLCPGSTGETQALEPIVTNPWFEMEEELFAEPMTVSIGGEGDIFYRIGNGAFKPYTGPFTVSSSCTMEAYSEARGQRSFTTTSTVYKIFSDRDIQINSQYSRQYSAGGPQALIDSRRGGVNWRTGGWQGYQGTDFEAIVDLRTVRTIRSVSAGFMQDARSWIWMPRSVEYSVSDDGVSWRSISRQDNTVDERDYNLQIWNCQARAGTKARYVKVYAKTIGTIPDWHPGAGYQGYIFIDEISVQAD